MNSMVWARPRQGAGARGGPAHLPRATGRPPSGPGREAGSAGVGPNRGGLQSLRPRHPGWGRSRPGRTQNGGLVAPTPCPVSAARPQSAGSPPPPHRAPAPPCPAAQGPTQDRARAAGPSPSGRIFLDGAAGGCRGPRVATRKPAGSVSAEALSMPPPWGSRGRKRFLQEGARRNTLSSPCTRGTRKGPVCWNCHPHSLPGARAVMFGSRGTTPVPLERREKQHPLLALSFSICKINLT